MGKLDKTLLIIQEQAKIMWLFIINGVKDQNNIMTCCKNELMCLKAYRCHYVPHTVLSVTVKNNNIHGNGKDGTDNITVQLLC